jgi:hypothetical protein
MDSKQLSEQVGGLVARRGGSHDAREHATQRSELRWRHWRLAIGALLVALALAASACGSSSKSSSTTSAAAPATSATSTNGVKLAKTKFALHAGLAFGAFHRWIYKPLKAGDFAHPLSHKAALVKAGLAGAFTYHELGLALHDAQSDPTLSKLVAPITDLQNKINGTTSSLKSGHADPAQIEDVNGSIGSIHTQAASAGQPITEQVPSSP